MSTFQVTVKVIAARGLKAKEASPDTFVVLKTDNDELKTMLKRGEATPSWNEAFGFSVSESASIKATVMERCKKDEVVIGEVDISAGAVKVGASTEQWFALSGGAGELNLKVSRKVQEKVGVDDFDLLAVIGKGSYGKVMQVRKKDSGDIFAMKVLRKDKIIARNQVEHTKSEVNVLQNVHHPFMVALRYSFQTPEKLYLLLEYINGGELFFHLSQEGNFNEDRARLYTSQILLALEHLHRYDIIYRDLKPENILLDADGNIRLTDFGLCKEQISSDASTTTFCGTPEYMSPEIVAGKSYGKAVDWWTLGTLLYEMVVGVPPFYSENVNTMYQRILTAPLRFPSHVSPECKSLLEMLLQRDPSKRLGSGPLDAEEIKTHPFFASLDWDKVYRKEMATPFKPDVSAGGAADTSNFDAEFTAEPAVDSVVQNSQITDAAGFEGFTYVGASAMDGAE